MDIKKQFGIAVRAERRAQNLSQEQLALKADISQGYLSLIEAGQMNATLETVEQVAKALGVQITALFQRTQN